MKFFVCKADTSNTNIEVLTRYLEVLVLGIGLGRLEELVLILGIGLGRLEVLVLGIDLSRLAELVLVLKKMVLLVSGAKILKQGNPAFSYRTGFHCNILLYYHYHCFTYYELVQKLMRVVRRPR